MYKYGKLVFDGCTDLMSGKLKKTFAQQVYAFVKRGRELTQTPDNIEVWQNLELTNAVTMTWSVDVRGTLSVDAITGGNLTTIEERVQPIFAKAGLPNYLEFDKKGRLKDYYCTQADDGDDDAADYGEDGDAYGNSDSSVGVTGKNPGTLRAMERKILEHIREVSP